jgi:Fe-S cluster biogenesis protein NfuA
MKMGIERSLRAAFGEQLVDVVQVGSQEEEGGATVQAVDMHLNMLRGAVGAYGGSVEVVAVEQVRVRPGPPSDERKGGR